MKKILVVDDDKQFSDLLTEILTSQGYHVRWAADGLEALELLDRYTPDCFIIDLIMPNIDGEKLSYVVRKKEKFRETPIIILSAIAAESKESSITEYCNCLITKMPMKKLIVYILKALEDFKKGNLHTYKNTVMGIEEVYPRIATRELLYSKKHLEFLLLHISDGYIELNTGLKVVYANETALQITGEKEENLLGKQFITLFTHESKELIAAALDTGSSAYTVIGEDQNLQVNNRSVVLEITSLAYDSHKSKLILLRDITERRMREEQLNRASEEKDFLMKELNHRVKNNLAMVSSLVGLKSASEDCGIDLSDLMHQIDAITIVHEKLHKTEDITQIDIKEYLQELLEGVFSFSTRDIEISVDTEVETLSTRTVVSLGLMVNEIATNAMKYGFVPEKEAVFSVDLSIDTRPDWFILTLSNSGNPFPEGIAFDNPKTLGLRLVSTLVDQLDGTIELQRRPTPVFTIRFSGK